VFPFCLCISQRFDYRQIFLILPVYEYTQAINELKSQPARLHYNYRIAFCDVSGRWHTTTVNSRLSRERIKKGCEMKHYAINTEVEWKWGNGHASGNIRKKYTEEIECTIKGSSVKRDASDKDPAYLIEQDDGSEVLKSHSEIQKAS